MAQQQDGISGEELERLALAHMWMPTQSWSGIAENGIGIMTEGDGIKVKDSRGSWSYDVSSGLMLVNVGHGRREIVDAVAEQLATLHYANTFRYATPPVVRLAEKLSTLTPGDLNRTYFVSGGSEAVETALKMAYQYHLNQGQPGRTKFIARQGSYHGVSRGALSVGSSTMLSRERYEPLLPDTVRFAPQPGLLYRDDSGATTASENAVRCAEAVEQIILEEGPETVAAVIGEPVSFSAGVAVPGHEYWPMLRDICDRHGVLLIADEVITGFGRTGKWFAMEHWDVVPDMITVAKGITSGYFPVGACIVRDHVFDAFKGGPEVAYAHGFTYGGHPAGGAAGLANIAIMEREDLPGNSARMGTYLLDQLKGLKERHTTVGDVRGIGLMCAVELVSDRTTKEPITSSDKAGKFLNDTLAELGISTRVAGGNLFVAPPLIVTSNDIDDIVGIMDQSIGHMESEMGLA
jgi:adenosylmethionine-8-amino-7-oxononanoate aminotransferase